MMTTKQRAFLKGLAMNLDPIFQIGKSSLTPELTEALNEALNKRELIKVSVLKNCLDDPNEIAQIVSERTHSEIVQVIGNVILEDSTMRSSTWVSIRKFCPNFF